MLMHRRQSPRKQSVRHVLVRRACYLCVLGASIWVSRALHADVLEQRIAERMQAHCATLTDAAARRECLADLIAFRDRHGLRLSNRTAVLVASSSPAVAPPGTAVAGTDQMPTGDGQSPMTAAGESANGVAPTSTAMRRVTGVRVTVAIQKRPPTTRARPGIVPAASAAASPGAGPISINTPHQPSDANVRTLGGLASVNPVLPLRTVQRRVIGFNLYVFRLSDGTAWEDVEGAYSRLRPNAIVRIVESRFSTATFMVSSNERRRVRQLACHAPPNPREAARCRALRDGSLTF